MGKIINYGIIGCGMMGQEHLQNIALLPDTQVGAIYEPNPTMQQQALRLNPHARCTASLDELLTQPLDCLVVASPNHLHLQQLEQIATFPHRPLLIEKPLFTNPQDLPRIESFASSYTAPVWVAMEYRYMPPIARLRQQYGNIGRLRMLSIREHRFPFLPKIDNWNRFNRHTGGTLVEKCCHFFDLMRLFCGTNPVRIMASAGQAINHLDERYRGKVPDIWDHGYVLVDFADGTRAMLELCMFAEGAEYQEVISLIGEQGKMEGYIPCPGRFWEEKKFGTMPQPQVITSMRDSKRPVREAVPVDPALLAAGDHNGSTFYQHQKFLQLVRDGGQPEVTIADGIWAVRMGQAAQKSAITGTSVEFD